MDMQISSPRFPITQAMRDRAESHREHLALYLHHRQAADGTNGQVANGQGEPVALDVVLDVVRPRISYRAEATLTGVGDPLHAEATADDLYEAIDGMFARLSKQARRDKRRRVDGKRRAIPLSRRTAQATA